MLQAFTSILIYSISEILLFGNNSLIIPNNRYLGVISVLLLKHCLFKIFQIARLTHTPQQMHQQHPDPDFCSHTTLHHPSHKLLTHQF